MLKSLQGLRTSSISVLLRNHGPRVQGNGFQLQLVHRNYETLAVKTVAPYVTHVEINRPDKLNAMNKAFWK